MLPRAKSIIRNIRSILVVLCILWSSEYAPWKLRNIFKQPLSHIYARSIKVCTEQPFLDVYARSILKLCTDQPVFHVYARSIKVCMEQPFLDVYARSILKLCTEQPVFHVHARSIKICTEQPFLDVYARRILKLCTEQPVFHVHAQSIIRVCTGLPWLLGAHTRRRSSHNWIQHWFKPPSILILTVPRRYFCCGSLLLLVLAVRIFTLVHLLF